MREQASRAPPVDVSTGLALASSPVADDAARASVLESVSPEVLTAAAFIALQLHLHALDVSRVVRAQAQLSARSPEDAQRAQAQDSVSTEVLMPVVLALSTCIAAYSVA